MNICIIGDGLTSLSLAKNLVNKKITVHIYSEKKKNKLPLNRTLGMSSDNFFFFRKEILDIKKTNFWEIKEIEIYSEKLKSNRILNFVENRENLFYMIKNDELYKSINSVLQKNKFFKFKLINENNFYSKLLKENKYDLIINCDAKNNISKKYFSKIIKKKYDNIAYTTILKHNLIKNNTATQIFTKYGPLAFLPISNQETSVVYSLDLKKDKFENKEIINLIKKYNQKYVITKMDKLNNFELESRNLRKYYNNNILAFGDCLHKIHPLAGQGFNMTIRDIKIISNIIQNRINLGIQLDSSIYDEFEKKTKHINFIFSSGVDFIFEFFNFNKKIKSQNLDKILKFFGKSKELNNALIKFANKGLNIL